MAKFHSELPNDLIKVFEELETNCDEMFGEMCKAGANVVYQNAMANMKKVFKSTRSLEKGLKITKVYHTPIPKSIPPDSCFSTASVVLCSHKNIRVKG